MEAFYYLMRKDEIITLVELDDKGNMLSFSKDMLNEQLAPLQDRYKPTWLRDWWEDRAVPISQGRIREFLREQGYTGPQEFLVKNLGLSLTDYYWVKPVDSALAWGKVNLFDNRFKRNVYFEKTHGKEEGRDIPVYSPNSSLQGDIEKTWAIVDGCRCIIKGNRTNLSTESINEVFASRIHELQGYDNYTEYKLLKIDERDYEYGCYAKAFTSQKKELVPAVALYYSEKYRTGRSPFQHFIDMCEKNGVDREQLQHDMDYQILTDFIISEYDRHLNNFGIIRDADTLKMERLAPIYDSGGCLFVNRAKPRREKDLFSLRINGLAEREMTMLKNVRDRNAVDLSKLPAASELREMYHLDTQMSEREIREIAYWYERKIDMCRNFQLGNDLMKMQYGVSG